MKKNDRVFTFSNVVVPIKAFPIFDITDQEADALRKVEMIIVGGNRNEHPFVCNVLYELSQMLQIWCSVSCRLQQKINEAFGYLHGTLPRYIAEQMGVDPGTFYDKFTKRELIKLRCIWITLLLAHHSGIKV